MSSPSAFHASSSGAADAAVLFVSAAGLPASGSAAASTLPPASEAGDAPFAASAFSSPAVGAGSSAGSSAAVGGAAFFCSAFPSDPACGARRNIYGEVGSAGGREEAESGRAFGLGSVGSPADRVGSAAAGAASAAAGSAAST